MPCHPEFPRHSKLFGLVFFSLLAVLPAAGQDGSSEWSQESLDRMAKPIEPFHIAGNLYYVGTIDVTAYLITTAEGHIVLDGGFPQTAEHILTGIRTLGFEPEDVELLLSSHAHIDHAGGLARLREATGAKLLASAGDAPLLATGYTEVPDAPTYLYFPRVTPDRIVANGEKVSLGGETLVAWVTAGHTPGCTSWAMEVTPNEGEVTEGDDPLSAVFICSLNVLPDMKLVDNTQRPRIRDEFEASFRDLEQRPCDLFLGSHGSFFNLKRKLAERETAAAPADPFVDPVGCREHIARKKQEFATKLAAQLAARESAAAAPSERR